jgi:mannose/cellobiose epimerase-like protein (N-acyl-D-glucosamine 2-epimerase family)
MNSSALGKSNADPFPTYRCRDGKAYGEPGCDLKCGDFKALSDKNIDVRKNGNSNGTLGNGPYEWLTGPNNELLRRSYIRMHSRQTYAYGVAFHLTGDPQYLALAHRGVNWLMTHAIDRKNGSYTFYEGNRAGPPPEYRTSQDQSYAMLGFLLLSDA